MIDLDALEARGCFEQAAEEAARRGLHERAAGLFERSCMFDRAASCALAAGDQRRALLLASLAADEPLQLRCIEAVASLPDAGAVAQGLRARGRDAIAARLLERTGDRLGAAHAWAASGDSLQAAEAFEQAGQLRDAARVLEAALQSDPDAHEIAVALGELLARVGRHEQAVRLLQRVPSDAAAGKRAAALLASSFAALGLTEPDAETGQHAASGPQPLSAQPATQVLYGRYELVGIAASSPNARVIEASDRLSGKRVAVKQLLGTSLVGAGRDAFRRLVQEARVLQQVRHPNVVPLVQLVEDDAAIVTEWMAGGSLARLIAEQPLAPARAAEIARVVLDALGEAHRAGVLHRDVKPSNILFDGAGNPMLADFGAAHISDTSSTATAGVIGTYAYMSPEQRAGLPATAASDVYAAGALLLEMLTGQLPADGLQAVTLPSAVHPELGGEHDRLVLSMLAREPAARPASALAARDAITSLAWSGRLPARSWGAPAASGEPRDTRLQPVAADVFRDTWLERDVQLVVLDEHTARLARAYAAATCDALPLVLRADTEQGQLWFEKPAGLTLSQSSRALAEAEVEPVARALQRLHQAGAAHGAVDAEHLVIDSATGNLRLAFDPDSARKATPEHDLLALAALTRR